MSTKWRNSDRTYTKKPPTNCAAARSAWIMIGRTTGKEITSLRLQNGYWKANFSDGMFGEFEHEQSMTRGSLKQSKAADRLRAAVELEKAETAMAELLGGEDTGYTIHDGQIESVH